MVLTASARSQKALITMLRTASDRSFNDLSLPALVLTTAMIGPVQAYIDAGATLTMFDSLKTQLIDMCIGYLDRIAIARMPGRSTPTRIEGVLHNPKDFDPKKKYPLLIKIHGGPMGLSLVELWSSDYAYPVQAFLAKGALVLEPNYRGSAGWRTPLSCIAGCRTSTSTRASSFTRDPDTALTSPSRPWR
jgi:predicted peptidase